MRKYVIKRFILSLVTIWIIITLTFFLMHIVPGNPFSQAGGKKISATIMANLKAKYHLDKSLMGQYGEYLKNLLKGDLGQSMNESRTANQIIGEHFKYSATIGGEAAIASIIFGILLGIWAAMKKNKAPDYVIGAGTVFFVSIPAYIVALFLQYFLATKAGLFNIDGFKSFKDSILPSISLALPSMAMITKFMRSSMLDVTGQDYIRTARSKGIDNKAVIYKHIIRNAILPVVTIIGPMFVAMMMGTFLIETIFSIPGIGAYFVTSVMNRDYTMIMATTTFYSVFLVFANFIVDLLYCVIDPRIRIS